MTQSDAFVAPAALSDELGRSIAVGDFDGDGAEDDVAIGASGVDVNGSSSGAVYVFYGPIANFNPASPGSNLPLDVVNANVKLFGERAQDKSGWAVANAGDLDQDGADDLLVGSNVNPVATGGASGGAGIAHIVRGGPGLTGTVPLATSTRVIRVFGQNVGDQFGIEVRGVGDVDGDSFPDVMIGAPNHTTPGQPTASGAAYLLSGATLTFGGGARYIGINANESTFFGETAGAGFGTAIAALGDVNGDGEVDIGVGAPTDASGGSKAGAAYVFHGSAALTGLQAAAQAPLRVYGTLTDHFGSSFSAAGDINSDGKQDFLVGAEWYATNKRGAVYLFLGASANTLGSAGQLASSFFQGADNNAHLGTAVVGDVDFNGDGHKDALFTANYATGAIVGSGEAYIEYGPLTNRFENMSVAPATFPGAAYQDYYGNAAAVADLNADGFADALVGAWRSTQPKSRSGSVNVYLGGNDVVDSTNWYADVDQDNFGDSSGTATVACDQPQINGVIYVHDNTDCNDNAGTIYPTAPETCGGSVDMNCDGYFDTVDHDGDGVGACNDCNDTNSLIKPGADELCDGVDNNCDFLIDDASSVGAQDYYPDVDGDSYGDSAIRITSCTVPVLSSAVVLRGGDCDDANLSVNEGAPERCSDNIDNDCDGVTNGNNAVDAITWWRDADGDTYGSRDVYTRACVVPLGYLSNRGDCNDLNADIKPNAVETCDFQDNDCNGMNYLGGSVVTATPYNTFLGVATEDRLGKSMAFVKDWDLDGDDEFVLTSPNSSYGASTGGVVYLRRGGIDRSSGYDFATVRPDGSHDYDVLFYATRQASAFGDAVVTGDFDGDGRADLAIGAPGARVPDINQGAVYVYFGPRANGEYKAEQADLIIKGEKTADTLGSALTVGDFDNDGYDDLVVAAKNFSDVSGTVGGRPNRGRSYILYGSNLKALSGERKIENVKDALFEGGTDNERAGASLAAGDINGDGRDDLFIGAPVYGSLDNGATHVLYSAATPWSGTLAANALLTGTGGSDQFGFSVAVVGDTNQDGFGDLLVGTAGRGAMLILGSGTQLTSGSGASKAQVRFTGAAGQGVGFTVSAAGDLNVDTYADFLIGAPDDDSAGANAGAQFIVYGRNSWSSVVATGAAFDINKVESFGRLPVGESFPTYSAVNYGVVEGARIRGTYAGQGMGTGAAAGGDSDGDGRADFIVSAFGDDRNPLTINVGKAYLYLAGPYGTDVGTTVTASQTTYYWDWDADAYADRGTAPPIAPNPPTFRSCPMHAPMDLSVPRIRGIPTIPAPDYHLLEDCDDRNKDVHPGATDVNNDGADSDCDGYDSQNTLPVLTVAIDPHLPTSVDTLTANVTVVNLDGDPITLFYQWYKKLPAAATWTPISGATTPTLATINFSKGDLVRVTVYADDTRAITDPPVMDEVQIGNTAPVLTGCTIVPASGGVTTPFSVAATGLQDDDPLDAGQLYVTYEWQKFFNPLWVKIPNATSANRGSCASTNYPSTDPLALYNCVRGNSIRATCTPHDPALAGTTLISDPVTIVNTLPVVESCYITPTSAGTTPDLTANGVGSDADEVDVVSISYEWLVTTYDGRTVTIPVGATYPGSLTEHFDAISLRCTPVDSIGGTGTPVTTSAIIISNTVPTAPTINLTPDFPLSNQDLLVTVTNPAFDLDGDALTYKYYWQKNGAPYNNPTYPTNNNTLSKTATTRGDTWSVTVVANDGYGDGASVQDAVLIRNTPPVFTSAILTPTSPDTRNDLLVNGGGWYDDDGDAPQYLVAWSKNGSSFTFTLSPQTTMPAQYTARGDQFQATVTAWDGYDVGNAITTAIKTIVNAVPDPGTLSILPNPPGENDTLNCNVLTTATDADGDALTYTVEWYRSYLYTAPSTPLTLIKSTTGTTSAPILPVVNTNTAWMLRADPAYPSENISNFGDKFYCKVTPNDGIADGASYTSTEQTIQDLNLPAAPVITAIPRYINEAAVRLTGSCVSVPAECKNLYFNCSDDGGYVTPTVTGTCSGAQTFTQDIAVNRGPNTTCYAYCIDQGNNVSANSNSVVTQSCATGTFDSYELQGAAYGDTNAAGTAGVSGVINEWSTFTDSTTVTQVNVIGNVVNSMLYGADQYDWYRFNTADNPTVDAAQSTNYYNFLIDMNVGSADYSFKVFRGATTSPQECAATGTYHQYQWYQRDRGDAPGHTVPVNRQQCADPALSSAPPVGNNAPIVGIERLYNDCTNNTSNYWVQVQRDTPQTNSCAYYRLNVSTGNTPPTN